MTHEPMEDYLRRRLKVELLKLDRMRAVATFPPDLQGPPEAGHGGGAAALLLEMVRMVAGERGGEMVLPRPLRIEVALHREIPLDTPLRAEVTSGGGIWHSQSNEGFFAHLPGIRVAMLDTGIDPYYPDLQPLIDATASASFCSNEAALNASVHPRARLGYARSRSAVGRRRPLACENECATG